VRGKKKPSREEKGRSTRKSTSPARRRIEAGHERAACGLFSSDEKTPKENETGKTEVLVINRRGLALSWPHEKIVKKRGGHSKTRGCRATEGATLEPQMKAKRHKEMTTTTLKED